MQEAGACTTSNYLQSHTVVYNSLHSTTAVSLVVTVCHIVVCVVMWYEFELMVRFDSVREMLPTRQHSAQ